MSRAPGGRRRHAIVLLALVAALAAGAAAQRRFRGERGQEIDVVNVPYNGQFTFVRVSYKTAPGGYWYRGLPAWSHGFPLAEQNLMRILNEITDLAPRTEEINSVRLDDPELFKYPVAYIIEVGWWEMTDAEAVGLREYLKKGGFLIIDDFRHDGDFRMGGGWMNLETNLRKALPEGQILPLTANMKVFDSFFTIPSFDVIPQDYDRDRPEFFGVFEDNDPQKRLMVAINYSTDVSNFWEFSATGFRPIEDSNQAYKLGVDYIIYGMTH